MAALASPCGLESRNPDWLRENKISILLQIGLEKESGYPDIPLLLDMAENEKERKILALFSGIVTLERPVVTTPDVSADRLAALRGAFQQTMKDPDFLAVVKKQQILILQAGEKLQKIVSDILAIPPEVVVIAKTAVERGGLGNCKEVSESKLCR